MFAIFCFIQSSEYLAMFKKTVSMHEKEAVPKHSQIENTQTRDPKSLKGKILHLYDVKYKQILIIPFLILFLSFAIIGVHYVHTGNFIEKGISLSGGSTITIQKADQINNAELKLKLENAFPNEEINVRSLSKTGTQLGIIVETTAVDEHKVDAVTEFLKKELNVKTVTVETIGPSLGESFFTQALYSVLLAFLFMAIVIFAYFRSPIPSSYVVLAAFSDIVFAWAIVILLNVKLSTAGIAAFLMLVGYSVDTDILLTTRVLKREGKVFDKIVDAFNTGIIMTIAAMAATGIAYLTTPSETLKQIMLILFWGLIADIIFTWLQNAGLLRLYVESQERKKLNKQERALQN